MELPSHPESEDAAPHRPELPDSSVASRVVVAVVVVLVVAIVVLHLTGVVGPGAH